MHHAADGFQRRRSVLTLLMKFYERFLFEHDFEKKSLLCRRSLGRFLSVPSVKSINTPGRIYQLLFAREERMAR